MSQIDRVTAGELFWTEVDLFGIDGYEPHALRPALEDFGIRVNYLAIGQPRHLVAALDGQRPVAPYVVLCCHGEDGVLLLPELAAEIAAAQPFNDRLGPDEVRTHFRIPGSTVIVTGCDTGSSELADAFLECGVDRYIAPTDAPEGFAAIFAVLFYFYELTTGRTAEEAMARMRAHDSALAMWRMWQR